jgi:hypothetical protein
MKIFKNLGDGGAFLHEMVGAFRMVGAGLHLLSPTLLLLLHDTLILRLRPALLLLKCLFISTIIAILDKVWKDDFREAALQLNLAATRLFIERNSK